MAQSEFWLGNYLANLLGKVFGDANPEQARQLDLIRQSTDSTEPGDGHLVDLIRALSWTPVEEEPESGEAAGRADAAEGTWREDAYGNED